MTDIVAEHGRRCVSPGRVRAVASINGMLLPALVLLMMIGGPPAAASPAAASSDEAYWTLNTGLVVELQLYDASSTAEAGGPASSGDSPPERRIGEVFDSPDFQRMLLWLPEREASYVLDLARGEVCEHPAAVLTGAVEDEQAAHPIEPPESSGSVIGDFFTQPDGTIAFSTPTADLLLRPAPELVGELPRDEIESRLPGFARKVAAYAPAAQDVAALGAVRTPSEVVAFFGTWCTACRDELPALSRTLDAAANPRLSLRMIGVDENIAEPHDLLESFAVSDIPTLLVLQGGIEIGRIIDEPRVSVEHDLAQILRTRSGR